MKSANDITDLIYKFYASDTGFLFGLRLDQKGIVKAIVTATLQLISDEEEEDDK